MFAKKIKTRNLSRVTETLDFPSQKKRLAILAVSIQGVTGSSKEKPSTNRKNLTSPPKLKGSIYDFDQK